jgi:serine protease Do
MGESGRKFAGAIALALLALGTASPVTRAHAAEGAGDGAWLGVSTRNLSDAWREGHSYQSAGVMVIDVAAGGPADQAGIVPGDVLVSIDSKSIQEPADVSETESGLEVGRPVTVVLARDGGRSIKIMNVEPASGGGPGSAGTVPQAEAQGEVPVPPLPVQAARAAAANDAASQATTPVGAAARDACAELGLRCENLSPDLAEALGAPTPQGLLVLDVKASGIAHRAGIRPGDLILQVADQQIADLSGLDQAIATASSPVSLTTLRHRTPQLVLVEMPGHPVAGPRSALTDPEGASSEAWRDRMLLDLRDEVRQLEKEVQELRARIAQAPRD